MLRYAVLLCVIATVTPALMTRPKLVIPKRVENRDHAELGIFDGGDLKLTEKQRSYLYDDRAGFAMYYRWAEPWQDAIVPYVIRTEDFSEDPMYVEEITEAMRIWEKETCVRFVERTTETSFIRIQDGHEGCNSYLGDIKREGGQPLNLATYGCMAMGTYLHEFGHALGLVHEHQRPDRDEYIHFYEDNILRSKLDNLKKYRRYEVRGGQKVDFDISSIMLYSLDAFSKSRKLNTFGVENTFMEEHINGRRYRHLPSFGDIKTINFMYKCHERCNVEIDCPEPGFINEHCECITKELYLGTQCKDDPEQREWCDKQARRGYCERHDPYMQRHCMKSCDFCPVFSPGTSGLVKPEGCVNHYSDSDKCDQWAKDGVCSSYPSWIQRHCRKSCDEYVQSCSKDIGQCANKISDNDCDGYRDSIWWDYCGSPKHWGDKAREECPDSCNVCPK